MVHEIQYLLYKTPRYNEFLRTEFIGDDVSIIIDQTFLILSWKHVW